MKGECNLKKLFDILEYVIIFFIGYLILNLIVTIVQIILYGNFGLILDFSHTYIYNFKNLILYYLLIFLFCFICNLMYNIYFIKKINKSLQKFKERGSFNEK